MRIAQQLKEKNIAEYLIYMWQVEDLIRANDCDLDKLRVNVIDRFPVGERDGLERWYGDLVNMMHVEGVTEKGHLQINRNVILNLTDLHARLLSSTKFPFYNAAYFKALPFIVELRHKNGEKEEPELETCFEALYGILLLRLQKKEISPATAKAMESIAGFISLLASYYEKDREGELDWHNDWETCYDKGYSTELITREAVRCIDAYEKEGPFLLYVAYNAPHSPLAAQEKDIRLYYDGDFDSLPADEKKRITYRAMVSCLDRGVGEIVKALKEKGIMDNTLFLFFSDNGAAKGVAPGASSGPLRGEKFKEWDGGVRSPAILCWKAAEQAYPAIHEQVTGFVDVVPTIREIVGDQGNPPHEYDGLSMLPVLRGETECIDRDFYLGCGAVVNRDYKFIKKGGNKGMNIQKDFLVDYKADPYERKNAAASHPEVVKRMARIAEKYDTITPNIPEMPFGKGQQGFKAPKEWKPVR